MATRGVRVRYNEPTKIKPSRTDALQERLMNEFIVARIDSPRVLFAQRDGIMYFVHRQQCDFGFNEIRCGDAIVGIPQQSMRGMRLIAVSRVAE